MALLDVLIVLGVLVGFCYLIFAKLHANNPELIDKIKGWFDKRAEIAAAKPDFTQQVHIEKRELI